nr:hypothetical protein [Actinomadura pelletieri]
MVERGVGERQVVQVAVPPPHLRPGVGRRHPRSGLLQGLPGHVHGREVRAGGAVQQMRRLRADTAADLQDPAPGRVAGPLVQQVGQGVGLVAQSPRLPTRVSVDISAGGFGSPGGDRRRCFHACHRGRTMVR